MSFVSPSDFISLTINERFSMNNIQSSVDYANFFDIVSHERSGTHFLINSIQMNSAIDLEYRSVGEWFDPYDQPQTQFEHIDRCFDSLSSERHSILKSHCDRTLFEQRYPKSKVVYIMRDYRDVLVSYYHFLDAHLDRARKHNPEISQLWFTTFSEFIQRPIPDFLRFNYSLHGKFSSPIERWLNHVLHWLRNPNELIKIVTYRQLYLYAQETIQEILDFLELSSQNVFTRSTFENAYSVMPRKGIIGDWKNHFTIEDADFLNAFILKYCPLFDQYSQDVSTIACEVNLEVAA